MSSEDSKTKTYIKFDGKDARKFWEWTTKTKAVAVGRLAGSNN